jgi:anaerobic magnesium-protoporphyrin IX monomethyl ester cyclase
MILLINPPSPFLINQRVHPPLGLLYLATYLREHEMDVQIQDFSGLDGYTSAFDDPDMIGITATTPQFSTAVDIMRDYKRASPGISVAIGGAHATSDPDSCSEFDHVVRGEGEIALANYRDWDQHIITYPQVGNIDTIPYPDRRLIDIRSYHYKIDGEDATTMITSRGCPNNCSFCSKTWQGVRVYSAEYVIQELKYLRNGLGYKAVMFFDDIFTLRKRRLARIAKALRTLGMIYRCFIRSDIVDSNTLKLLRETGCREVGFGAESGSQEILDIIGKNNSVERNTWLVEECRRLGIRTKAFLVVGLPGESNETCQATYDWIKEVAPDSWDIAIYQPYKGAPISNNPEAYDIEIDHTKYSEMWYKGRPGKYHSCITTSRLSSDEIVKWRQKIEDDLGGYRHDHPADLYDKEIPGGNSR